MKILDVDQIRALEQATIEKEPIATTNLLERAAITFGDWMAESCPVATHSHVLCGRGNNGVAGEALGCRGAEWQ